MKKTFFLIIVMCFALSACNKTDLSGIESRLNKLETEYSQLADAVKALQSAKEEGDYITSVSPVVEGNIVVGYTIKFKKSDPITIYNGKDGAKGKDGENGKDATSNVTVSYTSTSVVFKFADGTAIDVPYSTADFIKSIVSVTFVPTYRDGLPTMFYGTSGKKALLKYLISPANVAGTISKNNLAVNSIYTQTRSAFACTPLAITAFSADASSGIIELTVDGGALSDEYYGGNTYVSISLQISGVGTSYNTDFLRLVAKSSDSTGEDDPDDPEDPEDPVEGSTGKAKVDNAERASCGWVQLWKDGPKWAEFNVGAIITDYSKYATTTTDNTSSVSNVVEYYWTENVGGLYLINNPSYNDRAHKTVSSLTSGDIATTLWGDLWRMPTKKELNSLINYTEDGYSKLIVSPLTKWEWIDGEKTHYAGKCPIAGWKVSGVTAGYENNCIFLPAAGSYETVSGYTSTVYTIHYNGTEGYYYSNDGSSIYLYGEDSRLWTCAATHNYQYWARHCSVRAVLSEGED